MHRYSVADTVCLCRAAAIQTRNGTYDLHRVTMQIAADLPPALLYTERPNYAQLHITWTAWKHLHMQHRKA